MARDYVTKQNTPHAVYRMYATDGAALYIGCSMNPIGNRLREHGQQRPWIHEIALIRVDWYPDWMTGSTAEYDAIARERPKYNVARPTPYAAGRYEGAVLKACPKCHGPIQTPRPGKAYCNVCYREYRRQLRVKKSRENSRLVNLY